MFNELSLSQIDSNLDVKNVLEVFVKSIIKAKEIGFTELRLYEKTLLTLYQIELSKDYNIYNWLKDPSVDSDLQDRFREIVTSFPLITQNEFRENELYQRSEFLKMIGHDTFEVWGLGAAYIYDTLSISLSTHAEWSQSSINISHNYFDLESDIVSEDVEVKHFFNSDSLEDHLTFFNERLKKSLQKGKDLWHRRSDLFFNLILCVEVEKQLENISSTKILSQIIDRLKELDDYVKIWTDGNFNYNDVNLKTNLRISPESDITLQKYSTLRKFLIPGKGKKVFDLHIKTGDLRIHFYPDNVLKKIYIGYIGKHLRIASTD